MDNLQLTLTQEKLEAAKAVCAQNGFQIVGNSGTVTGSGVTLSYDYAPATGLLTLKILKKSGVAKFASDDFIYTKKIAPFFA